MTKVTAKKQKTYSFRLDPDQGQILWESKKHRIIPIESIKELRFSSDARYYRQQFQLAQQYEDRWMTIIYLLDGQYKTLHLIAHTKDVFQMWDITLRKLYAIRQELMSGLGNVEMREAIWEKQCWKAADEESDQKLTFEDVEKLCKRLNINSSPDELSRLFKQADSQQHGYLDFTDFQRFVKFLKARPEIELLHKKLCATNSGKLGFETFAKFMRDTQKAGISAGLQQLFLRYTMKSISQGSSDSSSSTTSLPQNKMTSPPLSASPQPLTTTPSSSRFSSPSNADTSESTMSLDGFTSFLLSSDNSAFTDQNSKIWQDMTHPISDYFISSSHNTYLTGHQLVGTSTIEGYIRALLHSCRSVELDIYDGDNEPMIYHGKTFTSKVPLRDICSAIAKYAFVTSPYPIIISAEIHCSLPQQELMVEIMRSVFGDALVSAPVDDRPQIDILPSPEKLKGRVLLKAKNLYVSENEPIRAKEVTLDTESSSTETSASDSDMVHEIKNEWKKAKIADKEAVKELRDEFRKARNLFHRVKNHSSIPAAISSVKSHDVPSAKPSGKTKMSMSVASLLVYTVGVKCRGINKKEHYAPEHIFSLSENTANKILKQGSAGATGTSMMDLIKHNKTHLVRTYPKGTRLSSSNYLPHRYWSAGAQLVAINWQTFDLGYMINHAMFQRNGRAGYVLKPEALRIADKDQLARRTQHFLNVTVISAQQLPRPKDALGREIVDKSIVDPYVEVSIHIPDWTHSPYPNESTISLGQSPPTSTPSLIATYRTNAVKNNGFNPVWQESMRIPFDCVGGMQDLIFVRFAVRRDGENDDEPIAVYCVSLGSLAMGYRHLPLHDTQASQYLFSTLFAHFAIHDA
ncbi:PLC-like phosphodiesterase [Hygrophoropsis aurantiaca]|uniref:PLC-like phosphodiesterase n=1 Tax=Hygrophoropsis aurantiaca TaxID=72124 RepID=A0ACB8AAV3_9AGAM|nr:PLC-like phosphodiesterase [Hygrophoropsis aurantiaca]